MKTVGLIGGMSWESTIPYYSIINEFVKNHLGGLHSAKIILYSVEFDEIEKCQSSGQWEKSGEILGDAARKLEASGADVVLICTNTMHKVFDQVQKMVKVPLLHIAEATASELKKAGVKKTALLGTRYTMKEDFYKSKLVERGLEVVIPDEDDMSFINHVIFDELCLGKINEESQKEFSRIIPDLKNKGAEAVILGCTEIGLLVKPEMSVLPVFDTTVIHATKAAEIALGE
ncbi:MAG: aspartate/glutamate racemase family protein [Treponema sp.]|uniref:aspartate/glutamate racemase family protein n=1 Tax=Treponema sp. TaxID=166 RepID=UPI00298D6274|nr:aspartate/glutamate racemase family protein [Treponema sp.]MCQ2602007.1 aspartate/glutamate racemase family protein [Treponema sp.]